MRLFCWLVLFIYEEADKKSIPVTESLTLQQLLDDIEWQLYTPFTEKDEMQDIYERALAIVASFQLKK